MIFFIVSIIFSPVLLDTSKIIASFPLFLANPFVSLNESLISDMSPKVIEDSLSDLIGKLKISSKLSNKLGTLILKLPVSLLIEPAGTRILLFFSVNKSSFAVRPKLFTILGSTIISISLSSSPVVFTSNTSEILSILFFRNFAILISALFSILPDIAIAKTGNLERLISDTIGSFVSSGSLLLTKSTLTRTSFKAFSDSNPASNSRITLPPPR